MPSATYSWERSLGRQLRLPPAPIQGAWAMRWWILMAVMTSSAIHVGLIAALGGIELKAGVKPDPIKESQLRAEEMIRLEPQPTMPVFQETPQVVPDLNSPPKLPPVDQLVHHITGDITISPETSEVININKQTAAAGNPGSPETPSALEIAGSLESKIPNVSASAALRIPKIHDDQIAIKVSEKPPGSEKIKAELERTRTQGEGGRGGLGFSSFDDLLDVKTPIKGDLKAMMPADLLFEYNSADLRESAKLDLMKLGFIIQTRTDYTIIIEGHTDTTGEADYNIGLSQRRADAVKFFVVDSLKINGSRIETRGLGEAQPLENPDGPPEVQALNRRVVIRFRKN